MGLSHTSLVAVLLACAVASVVVPPTHGDPVLEVEDQSDSIHNSIMSFLDAGVELTVGAMGKMFAENAATAEQESAAHLGYLTDRCEACIHIWQLMYMNKKISEGWKVGTQGTFGWMGMSLYGNLYARGGYFGYGGAMMPGYMNMGMHSGLMGGYGNFGVVGYGGGMGMGMGRPYLNLLQEQSSVTGGLRAKSNVKLEASATMKRVSSAMGLGSETMMCIGVRHDVRKECRQVHEIVENAFKIANGSGKKSLDENGYSMSRSETERQKFAQEPFPHSSLDANDMYPSEMINDMMEFGCYEHFSNINPGNWDNHNVPYETCPPVVACDCLNFCKIGLTVKCKLQPQKFRIANPTCTTAGQ